MNDAPGAVVGVFDSGVGGLSVVRELIAQLPAQPLLYLADQANAPYGQRSLDEIRRLSSDITRYLLTHGARVIVIACNTASAAALHSLRREYEDVPFIGMEPALKPAVARTRSRHVGVLATPATFQGELFASLVERFGAEVTVHPQVCPDWVPLVEAGQLDGKEVRRSVQRVLAPLLAAGIDELVLGCTHYPFLRGVIEEWVGPGVEIIDPAPAVARQTGRILAQNGWLSPEGAPSGLRFCTTGNAADFGRALHQLLGITMPVCQATWSANHPGRLENIPSYPRLSGINLR